MATSAVIRGMGFGRALLSRNMILTGILAVIWLFFTAMNPLFLSAYNLSTIVLSVSVSGVMACGMTLIIISRGIDLSIGSVLAMSGLVAAGFLGPFPGVPFSLPLPLALLLGLVPALAFGLLNGWIVTKFRVPPFIVTLGMMGIARGGNYVLTDFIMSSSSGLPVTFNNPAFEWIGNGSIGPLRVPTIILVLVAAVSWVVLHRTAFGTYLFAIGQDEEAARRNGIAIKRVKILAYVIMGLLSGISGLILTGRLSSASPAAGIGYEFNVITAVVLGGASLYGGEGSIVGTMLGVLIMGSIINGLQLVAAPPFWQYLFAGVILVVAVAIDMKSRKILLR
jgi:ribose/xylose/arabinose/galactoside ABC-type transport system permease subunit